MVAIPWLSYQIYLLVHIAQYLLSENNELFIFRITFIVQSVLVIADQVVLELLTIFRPKAINGNKVVTGTRGLILLNYFQVC